jgi:hypothetical protein
VIMTSVVNRSNQFTRYITRIILSAQSEAIVDCGGESLPHQRLVYNHEGTKRDGHDATCDLRLQHLKPQASHQAG